MANKQSYNELDFFEYYNEYVIDDLYRVSKDVYKDIIFTVFKEIKKRLIDDGRSVRLPMRCGRIQIVKRLPESWTTGQKRIDFHLTKQYGKTIYHLNEHSDGYKYRLHWDKHDCNILNKRKYQMIMSRDNKRLLAKLIKNKEQDYQES